MASVGNTVTLTERQLVTFHLGSEEFGADIMNVKEIIRISEITKVPNAPFYIEGVCNLRGNVLPIIDGRARFNMGKKETDENSRVLVIDINGKATGIVVDKVSEVMRVSAATIEVPPGIIKGVDSDHLDGIVKLDNGKRLIMLMDLLKVLNADDLEDIDNIRDEGVQLDTSSVSIQEKANIDEEHLVSFLLGKEEYAINIMQVKEIIRVPDIVKVPNCEDYIEGVVSIRNNLLPILNMREYFGLEHEQITDQTRVLVVDMGSITAGIMVDRVSEVIRVPKNIIQPPPPVFHGGNSEQLKGVAKLDNGKRLILLLEPHKLLSSEELSEIVGPAAEKDIANEALSIEKQLLDEEQLVTFKIGNEEFALKIASVQEINRMTEITKIPRAPFFINGIVNLRGNVVPVLNLRKRFGLEESEITDSTRIIIVDEAGKKTGILVDAVSEVLRFPKSLIEIPPRILNNGMDSEYIDGVGKLSDGKRMILIINLKKVLNFSEDGSGETEIAEAKKETNAKKQRTKGTRGIAK